MDFSKMLVTVSIEQRVLTNDANSDMQSKRKHTINTTMSTVDSSSHFSSSLDLNVSDLKFLDV